MAKIIFVYNGKEYDIQCNIEDTMNKICQMFAHRINIDLSKVIFIYSGNVINKELSFWEIANEIDKKRSQMNILVYELNKYEEENKNNKLDENDINELKKK